MLGVFDMIKEFVDNLKRSFTMHFWSRQYKNGITPVEAKQMLHLNSSIILLDVRSEQEHSEGSIDGSIIIPLYELYTNAESVLTDKEQVIIVYCKNGGRSNKAVDILEGLGYMNVFSVEGGIEEW